MKDIHLCTPAKLNLYLDVLSKRADGYHNIVTIFEKIDLCDTVVLKEAKKDITIVSNNKSIPTGRSNICYRAVKSIMDLAGINRGLLIKIYKKIPIGAGLGGGSSNAAGVLLGLNRLFRLRLNNKELVALAKRIGADVALFLLEASFVKGKERGDEVSSLPGPDIYQLIVYPGFCISTKEVYKRANFSLTGRRRDIKILISGLKNTDIKLVGESLYNRLENVVLPRYKILGFIKEELNRLGAGGSLLSGSGSSVFGLFVDKKSCIKAEANFRSKGYNTYLVKTFRD